MFAASLSNIYNRTSTKRFLFLIFLFALLCRILYPDLKLLHHDEAIHAWNSYNLLMQGTYLYDPMYHGPLLYYLTAGAFRLFGDSDTVARLLPGITGALLIPLVYGLYRLGYLQKNETIIAGLFVALSPDMVYFSRFLRHDIFQLVITLLLLILLLAYFERKDWKYAVFAGIVTGCGLCLKEDMPLTLLIFGTFFAGMLLAGRISLPKRWKRDLSGAGISIIVICSLFYSSLLSHPEMILRSPFLAIEFWVTAHTECRICGPPYYYLSNLLLYELPILILALIGFYQWGVRDRRIREIFKSVGASRNSHHVATEKNVGLGDKPELFMMLAVYWSICSLILYAWIGEKVPWLLIHQLLPIIFVACYQMKDWKIPVSLISCIFLIVMTWHLCFVPVDINEPIVQLQNSEDLRNLFPLIEASNRTVVTKDNYWPLPWYFRGDKWNKITLVDFKGKPVDVGSLMVLNPDILIVTNGTAKNESMKGYEKDQYLLSYSFSWEGNKDRLLPYYFLRDGPVKKQILDVYIKNSDLSAQS